MKKLLNLKHTSLTDVMKKLLNLYVKDKSISLASFWSYLFVFWSLYALFSFGASKITSHNAQIYNLLFLLNKIPISISSLHCHLAVSYIGSMTLPYFFMLV
jgi:hypothetical protein